MKVLPIKTSEYPTRATRPAYSVMDKTKIKQTFDIEIPYWRDSLTTCISKIKPIMKGIILAGGSGTRLFPITKAISKQLMPIYDKPMIYYPLSVLMMADIREILIITTAEDNESFKRLLGDGHDLGCRFEYAIQATPNGLAQAFVIGEEFIGNDKVALILGDNIFYGTGFGELIKEFNNVDGAAIFAYRVSDPERYGVVEFDSRFQGIIHRRKACTTKILLCGTGAIFL